MLAATTFAMPGASLPSSAGYYPPTTNGVNIPFDYSLVQPETNNYYFSSSLPTVNSAILPIYYPVATQPPAQSEINETTININIINLLLQQQQAQTAQSAAPSPENETMLELIQVLKDKQTSATSAAPSTTASSASEPAPSSQEDYAPASPAYYEEEEPAEPEYKGKLKEGWEKFKEYLPLALPVIGAIAAKAPKIAPKFDDKGRQLGVPAFLGGASPLTFDLNGDGVKTSTKKIQFDIDGDGRKNTINDISAGDGMLAIDTDGNGIAGEHGGELFGDNTDLSRFGIHGKFSDGFDALKALADQAKQRGLINSDQTLDADEIKTLEKEYGLSIKQGSLNNQATTLSQADVSQINLSDNGQKTLVTNFDGQGNDTLKQAGATFVREDGSSGNYEDIFFKL